MSILLSFRSIGFVWFAFTALGCASSEELGPGNDTSGAGAAGAAGSTMGSGPTGGAGGSGGASAGGSGGASAGGSGGASAGGSGGASAGGSGGASAGGSGGASAGGSGGASAGGSGGASAGGSGGASAGGSGGASAGGSGGASAGGSGGASAGGSGGASAGGSGGASAGGSGGVSAGGSGGGGSVSLPITALLDVDTAQAATPEVGPAAVGLGAQDYWNAVSGPFQTDFTVTGLSWFDHSAAGVDVHVVNLPGTWSFPSPPANGDEMYSGYAYSWSGAAASLTFSKLPAGSYVVMAYGHEAGTGHNSGFFLSVHDDETAAATTSTPTRFTATDGSWNAPQWTEGAQYVMLGPVTLLGGQLLRVNVVNGVQGTGNAGCVVNGVQVAKL